MKLVKTTNQQKPRWYMPEYKIYPVTTYLKCRKRTKTMEWHPAKDPWENCDMEYSFESIRPLPFPSKSRGLRAAKVWDRPAVSDLGNSEIQVRFSSMTGIHQEAQRACNKASCQDRSWQQFLDDFRSKCISKWDFSHMRPGWRHFQDKLLLVHSHTRYRDVVSYKPGRERWLSELHPTSASNSICGFKSVSLWSVSPVGQFIIILHLPGHTRAQATARPNKRYNIFYL